MLNRFKYLILYIFLISVILGCGGGSSSSSSSSSGTSYAFDDSEKAFLYNLFLTEYYWSDHVSASIDTSGYSAPQPMIDALKYSAIDKWSFALTQKEYEEMISLDKKTDHIKNIGISPIAYTGNASAYSIVQSPAGNRVGYFYLYEFSESVLQQIENAFTYFKAQNIDKLVIDLRYNGGGSINTASILLDKIGRNYNGLPQFTLAWNTQNSTRNETLYFDSLDSNSLALSKLVFLTTSDSASASEAVINAMKPYMLNNSAIVGSRTHGKPVGMTGRTNGSYIYFLINFVVVNSAGFYDYYSGLPADCNVADNDFDHQLGDPNEALLKEALFYIDNNHC